MKRLITVCALIAVCMTAILAGPASSQAASAEGQQGVQVACRDKENLVGFSAVVAGTDVGQGQISYTERQYWATTRCNDINIKFSSIPYRTYVSAFRCRDNYQFTSWKPVSSAGVWSLVATNVLDNTCFRLGFKNGSSARGYYTVSGVVAS